MKKLIIAAEVLALFSSILFLIIGFITGSMIEILIAIFSIVSCTKTISMQMKEES